MLKIQIIHTLIVRFLSSMYKPVNKADAKMRPIINIYQSPKSNDMNVLVTQAMCVLRHFLHSKPWNWNNGYLDRRYLVSVNT